MEYTVNKLSKLAGVSVRTLHYYDDIGLLRPARVSSSGYRIYGGREVDLLQQILFYRELGVGLQEIKEIVTAEDFSVVNSLESHLISLVEKRKQLDLLIANVENTIKARKGDVVMADKEKFEGFKQKLIEDNEKQYGKEAREKYGDEAVEASYKKIKGMTKEKYEEAENLNAEFAETLKEAYAEGDPASELAQKACDLHRRWLTMFYSGYNKEYHKGLAQMYVCDERFTQYYDKIAKGSASFLRDAINIYCK